MNIPAKNITCVYCIENMRNGMKYIGSTSVLRSRIQSHLRLLQKGKHNSALMQRDFDAGDDFTVSVLKEFPYSLNKEKILAYERDAIVKAGSVENGYNKGVPSAAHPRKFGVTQ